MTPFVPTTVEALRAALASTLACGAQELQEAVGQVVVATAVELPATAAVGSAVRSVHDAATRTTVLLADRIPAGQEAQALAQEIERHHGRQAAQLVLGERASELFPEVASVIDAAMQAEILAKLPAVVEVLEVAGQVNAAMESVLVQFGSAMTASDRRTRTENCDRLGELLGLLNDADLQPATKKFRVLGAHADTRNFFDIEVEAADSLKAFGVAARMLEEAGADGGAEFYAAIPVGVAYELPGESVVSLATVLDPEQEGVFQPPATAQRDVYGKTAMLDGYMSDGPGYCGPLLFHIDPGMIQVVMPSNQDAQGNFLSRYFDVYTALPGIESVLPFTPEHAQSIFDNLSSDTRDYCHNDVQAIQSNRTVIVRWENGSHGAVAFWGEPCSFSVVHFDGDRKGEHAFSFDSYGERYVSREEVVNSVVGTPEQRVALETIKPRPVGVRRDDDYSGLAP